MFKFLCATDADYIGGGSRRPQSIRCRSTRKSSESCLNQLGTGGFL